MCSFCNTHFFQQQFLWIWYYTSRTVNILTTNELVKLTTLWTTGSWYFCCSPLRLCVFFLLFGCSDKIDSVGNLTSPRCSSVNVMRFFGSSQRRKISHGHRHYNCPNFHADVAVDTLLPFVQQPLGLHHIRTKNKVREKSRECHNHKPQPFPDPKRKRKPTNPNKHKPNKRTKSTKISSLFPKRGNRNTKRTEKRKNKMTHGKTNNKSPRRINHKATRSKTNTGTTALERSVEQTTGGFKALLQLANFILGPDATLTT